MHHGGGAVERAADDADLQLRQLQGRAAVERHVLHFLGGDGSTDRGIFVIHEGHFGGDIDGLRGVADLERDVDHQVFARAHMDVVADEFLEAHGFGGDVVIAGEQEEGIELAGLFRDGFDSRVGVGFFYGDGDAGNDGAGWVGDSSADGSTEFLGG